MKDRKPFRLEKILIVYNALQVAVSIWLVYEVRWKIHDVSSFMQQIISFQFIPVLCDMAAL